MINHSVQNLEGHKQITSPPIYGLAKIMGGHDDHYEREYLWIFSFFKQERIDIHLLENSLLYLLIYFLSTNLYHMPLKRKRIEKILIIHSFIIIYSTTCSYTSRNGRRKSSSSLS
jgi:hypothetical protein